MDLQELTINNISYKVIKLLGKGKGGYSYLVSKNNCFYVIKQIHHEPCSYYSFGNKLESEINDYNRLIKININLPKLIEVDYKEERILKEYIHGPTIYDLVKEDLINDEIVKSVENIARKCFEHNINIDYYPTNFIVRKKDIFYIDYECNEYDEKWNFSNWGIKYYSKTEEFLSTLK
ncbi:MAG: hypothetical protein IJV94_00920 [Bacilli bacterium]|nr:hypothetical protein [Bacilli bacterium]